ncbi:MAG: LysM peptidoglycan-binding domain-containing protein [Gammaproteobacteria bacterium]|nr:LysM peptidoglycan-binding domain-containing protein [Gammaproteobacteria bacterium]
MRGNFIVYLIVLVMGIFTALALSGLLTKTDFWPDHTEPHKSTERMTTASGPRDSATLGATTAESVSSAADAMIGNAQSVVTTGKVKSSITETIIAPNDSKQSSEEINQELSHEVDLDGWSADAFVDSLDQSVSQAEVTVASDIKDAIRDDAVRQKNNTLYDPYLFNITQEARDLSVISVEEAKGPKLIRNLPASDESSDSHYRIVTVQLGETLSSIAQQEYGDPLAYSLIFHANRDILGSANELIVGQNLRIPDR